MKPETYIHIRQLLLNAQGQALEANLGDLAIRIGACLQRLQEVKDAKLEKAVAKKGGGEVREHVRLVDASYLASRIVDGGWVEPTAEDEGHDFIGDVKRRIALGVFGEPLADFTRRIVFVREDEAERHLRECLRTGTHPLTVGIETLCNL